MAKVSFAGLNPRSWNKIWRWIGLLVLVGVLAGLAIAFFGQTGNEAEPEDVEQSKGESETEARFKPCEGDNPGPGCFVDTKYPIEYLQAFYSTPENCWVAVDGFVYDVTEGPDGYQYPGVGDIQLLCGQDASERFRLDQVPPPPAEYREGPVEL